MVTDWPLVGRREELALIGRRRAEGQGVLISGAAGVGKSRLMQCACAEATAAGWSVVIVRASAGLAAIPFANLRAVVDVAGAPRDLPALAEAIAEGIRRLGQARPLLLAIDDAHLLDKASAGLLHRLAAERVAVLLPSVRTGEARPVDLTALWRDGVIDRLDLQPLSRREIDQLVRAALAGDVEDLTVRRLWELSEGNVLYLRELLRSSLESGRLRTVGGQWLWRGRWDTGGRLLEIVSERLGHLRPTERTVLELLSVAEPLGYELLTGLTGASGVRTLERRGLVTVESAGRRLEVRTSHPVHAETLRATIPALRARELRRLLADRLVTLGARRRRDQLLLASWSLEAGIAVDPVTLSFAAHASLGHVGQALADELGSLVPLPKSPGPAPAGGRNPARPDPSLATPLARAAWEASGDVADGVLLVRSLTSSGDIDEAEAVLGQLLAAAPRGAAARLAVARADLQFWGRARPDEALAALAEARQSPSPDDEPEVVVDLLITEAGIQLNLGRPARALVTIEAACPDAASRSVGPLAPTHAAALALLGRCQDALAEVEVALPRAVEAGWSILAPAQLLLAQIGALGRAGRLEEARILGEGCREVALAAGSADGAAIFAIVTGAVLLLEGRPESASRMLRDADRHLCERDVLGYRPWALSVLSRARALAGDEAAAASALAAAEAASRLPRYFTDQLHLARGAVRAIQGRIGEAIDAVSTAAAEAAAAEMVVDEALALDALMRLRPAAEVAERLSALSGRTDSGMVALIAAHAAALLAGDPGVLLSCSERFEAMGAGLMSAEAAAAAAAVLTRRHERRAARSAGRRAARLADRCEGARGPYLEQLAAPSVLTRREREVGALAVQGHSSREIAARLFLSVRTVDSHLYWAYIKLGVTDRQGLAKAFTAETQ